MFTGKDIGKILNDAYQEIYGEDKDKSNVFHGGNPGMIAIAQGLVEIATALHRIGRAEEEKNAITKEALKISQDAVKEMKKDV